LTLIALFAGGLSVIRKQEPKIEEKISLNILFHPPVSAETHPVQPTIKPIPEPPKATPEPKLIQPRTIIPPKIQPTVQSTAAIPKVIIPTPQPPEPAISKTQTNEPTEVKAPVTQPKEQPPKRPKDEYVYAEKAKVQEILDQRKIFPRIASKLKQYGEVTVSFDFTPSGEANNIRIIKSSGYDSLDDAAKELIKTSVSLFPKPRENVPVTVPIEYMR
jgi:protein TonB